MFKDFLKENEENVISFVTILIIIIGIIVVLCTFIISFSDNEEDEIINKISPYSYTENMIIEYENIVKNLLNARNTKELYNKLDSNYITKNNLNQENVKSFLIDNGLVGNSVAIISSEVFQQDEIYIFRYYYKNYSDNKYVNVIEISPNEYYISFDQEIEDIDMSQIRYSSDIDNIYFDLSLVEKNEDSVKFLLKVLNQGEFDVFVDFNDINTFSLIKENGDIYKLSGVVAQDNNLIQPNSSITRELYFSINSEDYNECIGMQVLNININGENKDIIIEF